MVLINTKIKLRNIKKKLAPSREERSPSKVAFNWIDSQKVIV